jgi:transcriptional regulator with XRE-family HTH domain
LVLQKKLLQYSVISVGNGGMFLQKEHFDNENIPQYSLEERMKQARLYANLTQPALSKTIGVSLRTLKKYEKDATNTAVQTIQMIAMTCGVDEVWLLTGQKKMIETSPDVITKDFIKTINANLIKLKKVDPDSLYEINEMIKVKMNLKGLVV